MASPPQILRELCEAAVLWRRTKNVYLQMNRSGNAGLEAAKRAHQHAIVKLDTAILEFEKLMLSGKAAKPKRERKPINWKKMVDGVAAVATTISKVTDRQPIIEAKVIDMPQE